MRSLKCFSFHHHIIWNPTVGLEQPHNLWHPLTLWTESLFYSCVVTLMTVVTCPGCNRAFTDGCSMCVHLYHSPQCHPMHLPSSTNLPFWLVPDELPFTLAPLRDPTETDSLFESDSSFPGVDFDDDMPDNPSCLLYTSPSPRD